MLSTRDPTQNRGHIQTESEGMEKVIPCKQTKRKQEQQYSHQIKQTLNKGCEKKQRWTLGNDKGSIQEEDITIINISWNVKSSGP